MFLKILQSSQENICARVSFFNKVAGLRPQVFFTEQLQATVSINLIAIHELWEWEPGIKKRRCPYSELLFSVLSRIRTEYGEIRSISLYLVQMRENTDQNNSEYGHFSRSVIGC